MFCDPNSSKRLYDLPLCYHNSQSDLTFCLPASWRGYDVVIQQWAVQRYLDISDRLVVTEGGPILLLRHPKWTTSAPYQDIPILVFTRRQWETHHPGTLGAGAVDEEINHNAKYVIAVSSRYNPDDSVKGWKETSNTLERGCERPHLYME